MPGNPGRRTVTMNQRLRGNVSSDAGSHDTGGPRSERVRLPSPRAGGTGGADPSRHGRSGTDGSSRPCAFAPAPRQPPTSALLLLRRRDRDALRLVLEHFLLVSRVPVLQMAVLAD